jgi:hypothetical protein
MLYLYFVHRRPANPIQLVVIFASMSVLVPVVSVYRHLATGGQLDVLSILMNENLLTSLLGNMGGTLWPLCMTIEIFPQEYPVMYGTSYAAAFLLLIPSFLRSRIVGSLDQVVTSPGAWLSDEVGLSYGAGFTPFAEVYMNFGKYGIVFMVLFGLFIGKILAVRASNTRSQSIAVGLSILAFLLIGMSTRGSFNYTVAFLFRYILIPYGAVCLLRNRYSLN